MRVETNGLCAVEQARAEANGLIILPAGPDAMAVVDGTGVKLASNELFECRFSDIFVQRNGRIGLRQDRADERFVALLPTVTALQQVRIGVPATTGGSGPVVVRLERLGRSCERRLVSVIDLSHRASPAVGLLQDLFGLTHSEAKVAQAVGEARLLQVFAVAEGLSLETVRSQLRAVFAKTGVRRQVELAVLVARLSG